MSSVSVPTWRTWLYSMVRLLPANWMPMRGQSWIKLCVARLPTPSSQMPTPCLVDHAGVMDVVVVGIVAGGRERDAIAAAEHDGGAADLVDVVADHAHCAAPRRPKRRRRVAGMVNRVAGEQAIAGLADGHGRPFATLQRPVRGSSRATCPARWR